MKLDSLPTPLLVTGITGVAGYNALGYFQRLYPRAVVGIRPVQTGQLSGPGIVPLDAEDRAGMRELFQTQRFRAVLNAAGNCALKACELDPAMAHQLNVESAVVMVENVRRFGCRLVQLSSDLVFSGAGAGSYTEEDRTDPVTVYGKTMAEAEMLVRDRMPEAAILRISLPMGPSYNRHAGAIDWIDSRFRKGRPATLYYDEVRSSTYVGDLNRVFERFLRGSEAGTYHLGGPRALSLYQIGQVINRVGGYPASLLRGCYRHQAGPVPPRAGNVSLESHKLIGLLGMNPFRPWPLEPELVPGDRSWHRRDRSEGGSFRAIVAQLYTSGDESEINRPVGIDSGRAVGL